MVVVDGADALLLFRKSKSGSKEIRFGRGLLLESNFVESSQRRLPSKQVFVLISAVPLITMRSTGLLQTPNSANTLRPLKIARRRFKSTPPTASPFLVWDWRNSHCTTMRLPWTLTKPLWPWIPPTPSTSKR